MGKFGDHVSSRWLGTESAAETRGLCGKRTTTTSSHGSSEFIEELASSKRDGLVLFF